MGGQVEQLPTQVVADQLALSQPEGADCAPTLLLAHPASGSFLSTPLHYVTLLAL